jgi:hypothetical protein
MLAAASLPSSTASSNSPELDGHFVVLPSAVSCQRVDDRAEQTILELLVG